MTQTASAVAIFCEDIRQDAGSQNTIVGTLPDNINIECQPPPPAPDAKHILPKLGVYLRINIDVSDKPKSLSAKIIDANGEIISQTDWDQSVIDSAFDNARKRKMPLAGFIFRLMVSPFPIVASGLVTAFAIIDGVEHLAGAVNINLHSADSTASMPPASQPHPDAPTT